MLKTIITTEHNKIDDYHKLVKSFYINELLRLDKQFDKKVRKLIVGCLKKGICPPKRVSLMDFTPHELLDFNAPVETHGKIAPPLTTIKPKNIIE